MLGIYYYESANGKMVHDVPPGCEPEDVAVREAQVAAAKKAQVAAENPTVELVFQVPSGAAPGTVIQFVHDGQPMTVPVPAGAAPGSSFAIAVAAPRPRTIAVLIPPGAAPGQVLSVADPATGAAVQVTVPLNGVPGSTIQVQAPPLPQQVQPGIPNGAVLSAAVAAG
jgi:hypothetical protein